MANLLEFKLSAWYHLLLLSKLKALQNIKNQTNSGTDPSNRVKVSSEFGSRLTKSTGAKNPNQCFQKGNEFGNGNDNLEQQYLHPAKCSSNVAQIHAFRKEFDKYVDPACQ